MASSPKKYYWLKLKDDFFQSKEIKKLRKIAGGDTYVIIYLKLQLLSIKNDGKILFEKIEESFIEEMALTLDEEEDNVKFTLAFLEKCNLIECVNVDEYILPKVFNLIGSETDAAERMRRSRGNKALTKESVTLLQDSYTTVTDELQTVTQREEIRDKKKEKEKEKENKENNNKNTLVCDDEFENFWLLYDKKVGKPVCIKKWNKISKEDKDLIFKNLPAYIKSTPDKKYRKNPETWLNQECWNDELTEKSETTEKSGDDKKWSMWD